MKASELRAKDAGQLNAELLELLKAQFSLRMQIATQQLSNTSQLGKVRKDIARVRTTLNLVLRRRGISLKLRRLALSPRPRLGV